MKKIVKYRAREGFTLIVTAALFIAFAVVIAAAIERGNSGRQIDQREEQRQRLQRLSAAIVKYSADNNGAYPCPAALNVTIDSPSFGVTESGCVSAVPAGIEVLGSETLRGMVPTKTLLRYGININDAVDLWGDRIVYVVNKQLTAANGTANEKPTITSATGQALAPPDFILLSYGRDRMGASPINQTTVGIACPNAPATNKRTENCNNDTAFFDGPANTPPNATAAQYYDDILLFHSKNCGPVTVEAPSAGGDSTVTQPDPADPDLWRLGNATLSSYGGQCAVYDRAYTITIPDISLITQATLEEVNFDDFVQIVVNPTSAGNTDPSKPITGPQVFNGPYGGDTLKLINNPNSNLPLPDGRPIECKVGSATYPCSSIPNWVQFSSGNPYAIYDPQNSGTPSATVGGCENGTHYSTNVSVSTTTRYGSLPQNYAYVPFSPPYQKPDIKPYLHSGVNIIHARTIVSELGENWFTIRLHSKNNSCTTTPAPTPVNCTALSGGTTIADGTTITAYNPSSCDGGIPRQCVSGTLSGNPAYNSATPTQCVSWYTGWKFIARRNGDTTGYADLWSSCNVYNNTLIPKTQTPTCGHIVTSNCTAAVYPSRNGSLTDWTGWYQGAGVNPVDQPPAKAMNDPSTFTWTCNGSPTADPNDEMQDSMIHCRASTTPLDC